MNRREKIILIVTLMVFAYGLIDFFILPKNNNRLDTGQAIAHTHKTVADFANRSMARISKVDNPIQQNNLQILISKIESDWDQDPFGQPLEPDTVTAGSSSPPLLVPGFVYSGYMHVGDVSFAIINGIEYRKGETMPESGYKVITITPKKVVLQKNTGQIVIFLKGE